MNQILYRLNPDSYEVEESERAPTNEYTEYIHACVTGEAETSAVLLTYQYLDKFGSVRQVRDKIKRNSGCGIFSLIEAVQTAIDLTGMPKMEAIFTAYMIAEMLQIDKNF